MYFGRLTTGRLPRCHARPLSCSRKNLLSFCWLLVGQALAFRALHDERGPFPVIHAERDSVGHAPTTTGTPGYVETVVTEAWQRKEVEMKNPKLMLVVWSVVLVVAVGLYFYAQAQR